MVAYELKLVQVQVELLNTYLMIAISFSEITQNNIIDILKEIVNHGKTISNDEFLMKQLSSIQEILAKTPPFIETKVVVVENIQHQEKEDPENDLIIDSILDDVSDAHSFLGPDYGCANNQLSAASPILSPNSISMLHDTYGINNTSEIQSIQDNSETNSDKEKIGEAIQNIIDDSIAINYNEDVLPSSDSTHESNISDPVPGFSDTLTLEKTTSSAKKSPPQRDVKEIDYSDIDKRDSDNSSTSKSASISSEIVNLG